MEFHYLKTNRQLLQLAVSCSEHPKQSSAFNLLRRLFEREQGVLRFMRDLSLLFTNNLAERAIRMPKVKQRISGCFRTLIGGNPSKNPKHWF